MKVGTLSENFIFRRADHRSRPTDKGKCMGVYSEVAKAEKHDDFSHHSLLDEAEVCSKIVIMDHGKIIVSDTPENLKHQYIGTKLDVVCTQTDLLEAVLANKEYST